MQGLQLTADLHGCPPRACMTDPDALRAVCLDSVHAAGLEAVRDVFHRFEPARTDGAAGITGVVLLAESHVAVHTWPELGAATLDIYVCNFGGDNSGKARALLTRLIGAFAPASVERHAVERGTVPSRVAG